MTTESIVKTYFERLAADEDWSTCLSDEMVFTSFTSPAREVQGKAAFLNLTRGFYSMIHALEVRHLMIDGDRACALTRYVLRPPTGEDFTSDVAEVFTVHDAKIGSFDIYFDSAPYPR
ncbi:MAG TPA: nuclear transport factor 2 family protein [Acidimicrobiia bacterium]|jgi:hypothetical protein